MDWKETAKKELKEVIALAKYQSPTDTEATERLETIRKKAEAALKVLEQN